MTNQPVTVRIDQIVPGMKLGIRMITRNPGQYREISPDEVTADAIRSRAQGMIFTRELLQHATIELLNGWTPAPSGRYGMIIYSSPTGPACSYTVTDRRENKNKFTGPEYPDMLQAMQAAREVIEEYINADYRASLPSNNNAMVKAGNYYIAKDWPYPVKVKVLRLYKDRGLTLVTHAQIVNDHLSVWDTRIDVFMQDIADGILIPTDVIDPELESRAYMS